MQATSPPLSVMAGLDPAIHAFDQGSAEGVDARIIPGLDPGTGHDGFREGGSS